MRDELFLQELCTYVGFNAEHAVSLRALAPFMTPSFGVIVDSFYDAILKNPRVASVFTGGTAQIAHQKELLHGWLQGLFGGVYDIEYLRLRARIGRTHVRIGLAQRYMFGAMSIVRTGLHAGLRTASLSESEKRMGHDAIDKICDLELAIMLETYAEDHILRMRDHERLAMLGQVSGFIGHELRNPLAVMETSLHLLKRRLPIGDERAAHHLSRARKQVEVCTSIISDLLDLARDRPLERKPISDLAQLVETSAAEVRDLSGIELSIDVASDLQGARVDANQTRRLLVNLIANACQALIESPIRRVAVQGLREADKLLLVVEDSGPGIADEVRHRLFEPLATTRAKGLGLGLALCRRIAEKHGGDIRALVSGLGGARFEVRLAQAFDAGASHG